MDKPQIVRLWGTADNFEVEFSRVRGIEWNCSIPADLEDGVYACEFTALNEIGETATWVGELFMCNGVCHLHIEQKNYSFWFKTNISHIEVLTPTRIEVWKGCMCDDN